MKNNNIQFVVASGNQYFQLRSFFPNIMKDIVFVAENSAYIGNKHNDVFVAKLEGSDVKKLLK